MRAIGFNFLEVTLLIVTLIFSSNCQRKKEAKLQPSSIRPPTNLASPNHYHWPNKLLNIGPIQLSFSDDFSEEELTLIKDMAGQWEVADPQHHFFGLSNDTVRNKDYQDLNQYLQDDQMGIYKSYDWFDEISWNTLAITQFQYVIPDGKNVGELVHADIIINSRDFEFFIDESTIMDPSMAYDLPSVVLHELGHFLGLGHTYNISVMLPYMESVESVRELYDYDIFSIKDNYKDIHLENSIMKLTSNPRAKDKPTVYRGIIELKADGQCTFLRN